MTWEAIINIFQAANALEVVFFLPRCQDQIDIL